MNSLMAAAAEERESEEVEEEQNKTELRLVISSLKYGILLHKLDFCILNI